MKFLALLSLLGCLLFVPASAQSDKPLPLHPQVVRGTLPNGLTYYLLKNGRPAKRVELRLAINAGSILEDDSQQGLAHFLEHMCFNGSKNFQKQELVNFMESIGMRFGGDVNAYTSFDETVYMLQVPTDDPAKLDKAFLILHDWASELSLDPVEIDKERGVIIEEWRGGRGADARMRDKQFPILYQGSRYANRLPIGKKEILESFVHSELRRFYQDWYRPDLMAVVVVGDLDIPVMESYVKKHFASIPARPNPTPRPVYTVPDHRETLFAIASDKEATRSSVTMTVKLPTGPEATEADFRHSLVEQLALGMLSSRLRDLAQKSDPPFISAAAMKGRGIRTKESFILFATTKDGAQEKALEVMWSEALRASRHGFVPTEMERQKKALLRGFEQRFTERDKTESRGPVMELVRYYLNGDVMQSPEQEYTLAKSMIDGITLQEAETALRDLMRPGNRVVSLNSPEKEGLRIPDASALAAALAAAEKADLGAYKDELTDKPLVATPPSGGKIVSENTIPELGLITWTLSNGVTVQLKPTDFKNDEILFSMFSPGGLSRTPASQVITGTLTSTIQQELGFGAFSGNDLRKLLSGKVVRVSPAIRNYYEGLSGNASPKDLETLFQLVYLTYTAPRHDATVFASTLTRLRTMLENRSSQPETAFEDTIQVTMASYHPRVPILTAERLKEVTEADLQALFRDRFADASEAVFTFVGSFSPDALRPLVERWLGGLPSTSRKETWVDMGVTLPRGVIEKTVRRGQEQKSSVRIVYSGALPDASPDERFFLNSMTAILRTRLRELIREDKGGTYGVGVMVALDRVPKPEYRVIVTFGCNPARVDELVKTVFDEVQALRTSPIGQDYVDKVKEQQKRGRETAVKENTFWLGTLEGYAQEGTDPRDFFNYEKRVDRLTPAEVQRCAAKYLDPNNLVKVVLQPEG